MSIDDKAIVQAIRERTEVGFRLLMQKYMQPIYWHIRRLVVSHDDAQDATQEVFIRVLRSFNQLKDEQSFKGWLFRIATNEALRLIESRKQNQVSIEAECSEVNSIITDSYVDYSDLEAVNLQNAIKTLPSKQQLAFNLRYYDDLNYDEIAEVIGSSPSSAKVNFHIAKDKIIKYMNSNE